MSQLPKTLKNYTYYADGVGYAGRITEGKPPTLAIKTEDFEGGGLGGPVALDMGQMEKMESEISIGEYNPELHALIGKADVLHTLRGAQGDDAQTEAVIYQMRGPIMSIEPEAFGKGAKGIKVKIVPRMLKVSIGGREIVHIDLERNIRAIGGVDQMAGIRQALGQ